LTEFPVACKAIFECRFVHIAPKTNTQDSHFFIYFVCLYIHVSLALGMQLTGVGRPEIQILRYKNADTATDSPEFVNDAMIQKHTRFYCHTGCT